MKEVSMDKIFNPKSVLVVGVSEKPNNLGRAISTNLMRYNYQGDLYLIGRNPGQLEGHKIVSSFDELPDNIDLAVLLTPAQTILDYLEECGRKGIHHAIVESAGFGELSDEGRELEQQMLQVARKWDMRLVGPNCVGVISTESGLNSVFVNMERDEVRPGSISALSQSGGIILTYADLLGAVGLGLNKAVSVGNKIDLKEADYLTYFLQDDSTTLVHCYLESVVTGRDLLAAAGEGRKPIVIYKSNTSQASAQIAQSHTAALANDDRIVDAAFRQFGITRAHTFRDMVLYSKGFAMPPVKGNRLAVLSRSGGHAIVSTDLANQYGFELPPYPQQVLDRAKEFLRADVINLMNPLDLGGVFDFDAYPAVIKASLEEMKPDGVILIFNYRRQSYEKARQIAEELKALSLAYETPIAMVYFAESDEVVAVERDLAYPIFVEVADAMEALAASRDSYIRRQELRTVDWPDVSPEITLPSEAHQRARQIVAEVGERQMQAHEAFELCEAYGIPAAPWALAENEQAVSEMAREVGYPLALKVVSPDILHKSDAGGVMLDIKDAAQLKEAVSEMMSKLKASHPKAEITGFLLQKMIEGGREVILGSTRDRSFGPTVVFGLGGIYVEVFDDAAIRVAPITRADAAAMIEEPRGSKLLAGVRGEAPADKEAIKDCLLKLSQMVMDNPEIVEVDINPLVVFEHEALAVDARVLLRPHGD